MRGDYDRRVSRIGTLENADVGTQNLWITL